MTSDARTATTFATAAVSLMPPLAPDWIIGLIDTAEGYTAPYEGPSRQLAAALLANDDLIEGTDSPVPTSDL